MSKYGHYCFYFEVSSNLRMFCDCCIPYKEGIVGISGKKINLFLSLSLLHLLQVNLLKKSQLDIIKGNQGNPYYFYFYLKFFYGGSFEIIYA